MTQTWVERCASNILVDLVACRPLATGLHAQQERPVLTVCDEVQRVFPLGDSSLELVVHDLNASPALARIGVATPDAVVAHQGIVSRGAA